MKFFLVLSSILLLSGCVYNQHTHEYRKGVNISQQQINLVESGRTTKEWVLANFGIPDRSQTDKDGLEVFEYVCDRTEKSDKTFIFLFNINSEKEISHKVTRLLIRNGVVASINSGEY